MLLTLWMSLHVLRLLLGRSWLNHDFYPPRFPSDFSMHNIVMGLLAVFMLSGNEDWRKLLRFSFTQRNTSSGFFSLMLSCGGHLSRYFSLVKDHRILEVDQLAK